MGATLGAILGGFVAVATLALIQGGSDRER